MSNRIGFRLPKHLSFFSSLQVKEIVLQISSIREIANSESIKVTPSQIADLIRASFAFAHLFNKLASKSYIQSDLMEAYNDLSQYEKEIIKNALEIAKED